MSSPCKCLPISGVVVGRQNGARAEFQRCVFSLGSPAGVLAAQSTGLWPGWVALRHGAMCKPAAWG